MLNLLYDCSEIFTWIWNIIDLVLTSHEGQTIYEGSDRSWNTILTNRCTSFALLVLPLGRKVWKSIIKDSIQRVLRRRTGHKKSLNLHGSIPFFVPILFLARIFHFRWERPFPFCRESFSRSSLNREKYTIHILEEITNNSICPKLCVF